MTSKDLRYLMSTELDTLAPMPDLVPQVIRQGATQVRRRRLAVGGLVAAAAIGGVAVAPWASGRGGEAGRPAADGTPTATPSAVPTPIPLGGSLDLSDPEVMAAFDVALPERFSRVRLMQESSAFPAPLTTSADGTQLRIQIELAQGEIAALERCAEIAATEVETAGPAAGNGTCDIYDTPPWATRRKASDGLHTVIGRHARKPWFVTVRFAAEQPVPLSDAEVLDLLTHPKFLAMLDSRTAADLVQPSAAPTAAPTPTDPPPSDAPGSEDTPSPTEAPPPPPPVTTEPTEPPEDFPTYPEPVPTDPGEPSDTVAPTPQPTGPPTTAEPTPSSTPAPTP
ncbi:hypothetical protein [Nocardioides speluncae]|uniref:hypothetical protein n=1 Tax=Nocardioides speluncae TaxID=2670337 RepID=UPI000D69415A|nr:hypothetical protein [Nocardioides speluncae]